MIRLKPLLNEQSVIGAPSKGMVDPKSVDIHTALTIASILAVFIPVVGPVLSAGIALGDAAIYAKEGDSYNAGLTGTFAVLPLISPIARLAGISKLGKAGMAKLGSKLAAAKKGTAVTLSKTEQLALKSIQSNKELIKRETDTYLANLVKRNADRFKSIAKPAKQALIQTAKSSKTRTAAALLGALYVVPGVYDWAYYNSMMPSESEVDAMLTRAAGVVLAQSINDLRKQSSTNESVTDKNTLDEAIPLPTEAPGLMSQVLDFPIATPSGLLFTIITAAILKRGIWWILKKKGLVTGSKRSWREIIQVLRNRKTLKTNKLVIPKNEWITIIDEMISSATAITKDANQKFLNGSISIEQALEVYKQQLPADVFTKYENYIKSELTKSIQSKPYTKRTIGFQQTPKSKYKNISADDLETLTLNQKLVLDKNPDMTMSQLSKY